MIQDLIDTRAALLSTTRGLQLNAAQISRATQSKDDEILDSIEAIERALGDLSERITTGLPSVEGEAHPALLVLGEPDGWGRYERSLVHDLRNPLGVALGYSEIFDETLEEFYEAGDQSPWISHVRELINAFSDQLQHFNRSLDVIFPKHEVSSSFYSAQPITLIPMGDTPAEPHPLTEDHTLGLSRELLAPTDLNTPNTTNIKSSEDLSASPVSRVESSPTPQPTPPPKSAHGVSSEGTPSNRSAWSALQGDALDRLNEIREARSNSSEGARVLIVDDSKSNRDLLASLLKREGLRCDGVSSAREAKQRLEMADYDLILLDLMMPEVSGDQLLEELKLDPRWQRIPVLMISGMSEVDAAIRCIELGAEDFLQKPFNRVLLKARIGASIEKKRLSDEMQAQNKRFKVLLNRILPAPVVERLDDGESMIADRFESTTILFSDLVGFTQMSSEMSPTELILTLDEVFSAFDSIAERFGVEKIKTIGDAYMAAAGLPVPHPEHADAVVLMGIEMIRALNEIRQRRQLPLHMRVGIHSGPVAAGIIGQKRFLYDVWGDTVNVASRLEASSEVDAVHISFNTYRLLKERYEIRPTGGLELKGKGFVETFLIKPDLNKLIFKPLI